MKKSPYFVPISEECTLLWDNVLCSSGPDLGGTEDVGYEDWVIDEQV